MGLSYFEGSELPVWKTPLTSFRRRKREKRKAVFSQRTPYSMLRVPYVIAGVPSTYTEQQHVEQHVVPRVVPLTVSLG